LRAVVQRVNSCAVSIEGRLHSAIERGLLVLLGITADDNNDDIDYIIDKIINLRIFPDSDDRMNCSLIDYKLDIMVVSQFTLYGDARKGRRPSFASAAGGDLARSIYDVFIDKLKAQYKSGRIGTGDFGKMMDIQLVNNGPVTILLDSKRGF